MQPIIETRTPGSHARVIRAAKVQGTAVTNRANEDLGTIRDVVLDKYDGSVRYAVLEFGGFLGLGSKLFALPWELLSYEEGVDAYVIGIDKEVLRQAPGFDSDNWPDMGAVEFDTGLRSYYGLTAEATLRREII
ncbi:MAG TPA: PRC-barrel domain-containing protein [Aliidongia sp.]|uniref:PRC-barrel domain-containing protein n=1 Tax=Aliidongia sp. TaxID=1914230 RepID=UPI002DDD36EA|nr:PRC-barrel domain-containing protein [Aliidongia sp.]HEV2675616.1 PRC-barrel domain-containing protein [Aliidongia sp.]